MHHLQSQSHFSKDINWIILHFWVFSKHTIYLFMHKLHFPVSALIGKVRRRTSCRCPTRRRSANVGGERVSRWRISRSRDPEAKASPFQAKAPTRAEWPSRRPTILVAPTSQTWTCPLWVPTATRWPYSRQGTHIMIRGVKSNNTTQRVI